MKNTFAIKLCVGLLGLLFVGTAHALPITWSLDVTFSDGNTADGTYVFDADLSRFLSFDITSTSGNSYGFVNSRSSGGSSLVSVVASDSLLGGTALMFLQLAAAMTNAGGTIDILPGFIWSGGSGFSLEGICTTDGCTQTGAYRDVVSGFVTTATVPAPGTLALVALGVCGLGFVARKKNAAPAAA